MVQRGHFVYTSGLHGGVYLNKDALYPHTTETSILCEALAKSFKKDSVEVVVAPTIGGVILSQWVAYHLQLICKTKVLAVFAEKTKDGNSFELKRGYDELVAHKRVLVLEDIINTGGSVKKVVDLVRKTQAQVVGVGAIWNRGGISKIELSKVPKLVSLVNLKLEAWEKTECHLCKAGRSISTNLGKGTNP